MSTLQSVTICTVCMYVTKVCGVLTSHINISLINNDEMYLTCITWYDVIQCYGT